MYSFDDYLEYVMDVPGEQRDKLLAELDREDPALAKRLRVALVQLVRNRDFLCERLPEEARDDVADRLLHANLRVQDLERAVQWYITTFRCELVRRNGRRAVLAFDGGELQLYESDEQAPRLTLQRRDVARMGASFRRADGVRALNLTDPWGNAIEVVDGPPAGA